MANTNTKEKNDNVELTYYQKARLSMSHQERIHFVLKENGNCEDFLEMQMENGFFAQRFFILDLSARTFSCYTDNPNRKRNINKVDSIEVSDITKVSEAPLKIKKNFAFEVNIPSKTYILAAKDERDMKIWMQALKKAAMSPFDAKEPPRLESRKAISLSTEHLNVVNERHSTSIIGGCVITTITTPTSTLEKRSHSNALNTGGLRILKEGFCWKQGAVMKNWKKRYFRLNAVKLSYYTTKEEPQPIRSINTNDILNVRVLEKFVNRTNVVEVETPSRKFYMDAEDSNDVTEWKIALEDIVRSNCTYIPKTKSV